MSKEVDKNNVAMFQEGQLVAFGTLLNYEETDDSFKTEVIVEKGSLRGGDIPMQVCREYDVITDNCMMSAN